MCVEVSNLALNVFGNVLLIPLNFNPFVMQLMNINVKANSMKNQQILLLFRLLVELMVDRIPHGAGIQQGMHKNASYHYAYHNTMGVQSNYTQIRVTKMILSEYFHNKQLNRNQMLFQLLSTCCIELLPYDD